MGSKSSSGSLLKSVESMLPKNMNMKHVLLAVLVGLLLCMLMGQTVETFTGTYANTKSQSGFCRNSGGEMTTREGVCVGKDPTQKICYLTTTPSTRRAAIPAEITKGMCGPAGTVPTATQVNAPNFAQDSATTGPTASNTFCAGKAVNKTVANNCNITGPTGTPKGYKDFCEPGTSSALTDCSIVANTSCPDHPDSNESTLNSNSDEINNQCSWYDCSSFASGTDNIRTAIFQPFVEAGLGVGSLERWRTCVAEHPAAATAGGWAKIKTDSKAQVTAAWDGDKWQSGTSIGKPYSGTPQARCANSSCPTGTEVTEMHPIYYRDAPNSAKNSFISQAALPDGWQAVIDEKLKFCAADSTTNPSDLTKDQALDKGAVLGWDMDGKSLICLNNNPAVKTRVSQQRVSYKKVPGCGEDHTLPCYCSSDGCPCPNGKLPTPSQLDAMHAKCEKGAVGKALDIAEVAVKKQVSRGAKATAGTIDAVAGTLSKGVLDVAGV